MIRPKEVKSYVNVRSFRKTLSKLCDVSVRTVQYYDTRGILVPSQLSEGGRRLYSEQDLGRMRVICFLRELGISINGIATLLADEHPEQPKFVMINAWNEWVEGSYLLPDRYWGYGWLEAVKEVFGPVEE